MSGAQAASCSAGVRIPMAECGRVVPVPVDPLGGGEHGRRRCPPKGPGYGSARPCTRSSEPRPEQSRKESPLEPTEATAFDPLPPDLTQALHNIHHDTK